MSWTLGLITSVAELVDDGEAVQVEVPEGAVGKDTLENAIVLLSLYVPVTEAVPLGATTMTHAAPRMLDWKVAPALGIVSFAPSPELGSLLSPVVASISVNAQLPLVALVWTVSVPPRLSVQPLIVGGPILILSPEDGILPLVENVVQVTVIGDESIVPTAVKLVPDFRAPFSTVPAGLLKPSPASFTWTA